MKKHLVYAEDILYELMQYPNAMMSKGLIKAHILQAIQEREVNIWQHIWNNLKALFKRA